MNLLIEIEYSAGTEYYTNASKTIVYSGKQYKSGLILGISGVSRNMGIDGRYESGRLDIKFNDIDRHFRSKTETINTARS